MKNFYGEGPQTPLPFGRGKPPPQSLPHQQIGYSPCCNNILVESGGGQADTISVRAMNPISPRAVRVCLLVRQNSILYCPTGVLNIHRNLVLLYTGNVLFSRAASLHKRKPSCRRETARCRFAFRSIRSAQACDCLFRLILLHYSNCVAVIDMAALTY